jgi:hypothetical protein
MKINLAVTLAFFFTSCSNNKISLSYKNIHSNEAFEVVSFNKLLKKPEAYQGKNIELTGFYKHSFEKSALYITRSAAVVDNQENALWISFDYSFPLNNSETSKNLLGPDGEFEKLNKHLLRIRGKFDYESKGHLGAYFGELSNIVSIEVFK